MLSNTPITSCPALPLPHMSHFSRAHPYPSVLFSPYLCLCSFSFAWKPLPTILCWPHSSTSCKSSSGPPPQEALHDWLPPLPAASTYSPLRLWPVGNRSQSAGHVSLRCTDHFVVGLSVFPASWGRCLTLLCSWYQHPAWPLENSGATHCTSVNCMDWIEQCFSLGSSTLSGVLKVWGGRKGRMTKQAEQQNPPSWLRGRHTWEPDCLRLSGGGGRGSLIQGLLSSLTLKWKWLALAVQPFLKSWPRLFPSDEDGQIQHAGEMDAETHVSHPGSSQLPAPNKAPRKDQRLHMARQWQIYEVPSSAWKHCVFNLPSGNKSISSFCWRNCKSATLLHKDVRDLFKATLPLSKNRGFLFTMEASQCTFVFPLSQVLNI